MLSGLPPASIRRISFVCTLLVNIAATGRADNFWMPFSNPPGGPASCFAYDATQDALFAGAGWLSANNGINNGGTVFRSSDHGASWVDVGADIRTASVQNSRVRTMAVGPTGVVLAGTDVGIYRSLDGGAHWALANTGLQSLIIRGLAFDPNGLAYLSVPGAVLTSVDNGGSWSYTGAGMTSSNPLNFAFGPGYVLLASRDGLFKRSGQGSWLAVNNGLTDLRLNAIQRAASGILYAATDTGLSVSSDNAASWSPLAGPFSNTIVYSVLDTGVRLLAGARYGLFVSTDGGQNWSPAAGCPTSRCMALIQDGSGRIQVSTQDGLFRSLDGGQSFARADDGFHSLTIHALVVARAGAVLAGTFTNGVYRSTDGGQSWEAPQLTDRNIFKIRESPWGDLFLGNYTINNGVPDGHAWRSQDHGQTWIPLDNGLSSAMVSDFTFLPSQQVWCTSAWNPGGVSFSNINGDSWGRLGPPQNIPAYCLARSTAGDLYFGSEGLGLWRYSAAGGVWENKGLSQSQQFSIEIDSQGRIFVGNDRNLQGVYRSTDNGQTFSPLTSFPGQESYSILILPNDELFATTRGYGIQHSTDHGNTWQALNDGIPNQSSYSITLGPDGHLFSAAPGYGIYRSSQPVSCAPVVSGSPGDATACRGGSVQFQVVASAAGGGPPMFQWRKDGVNLQDGPSVTGAATATLLLTGIVPQSAGAYDCIVSNSCGAIASAAAALTVCGQQSDLNCDFVVDLQDLAALLAYYGQASGAGHSQGDLDGDGDVDLGDLSALLAEFGAICS